MVLIEIAIKLCPCLSDDKLVTEVTRANVTPRFILYLLKLCLQLQRVMFQTVKTTLSTLQLFSLYGNSPDQIDRNNVFS